MDGLAIIIVNWNTRELLLDCLASIERFPPERPWRVWVVDNASSDGSVAAVRERFPGVHVLANERNVGFAAANNQAIAAGDSRYVLLLNSDTAVLEGTLEGICRHLDHHPDVGAAGCRLLNGDGSLQRSCWRGYPGLESAAIDGLFLWRLFPGLVAKREASLLDTPAPLDVDHLLGACIVVRRSVIDQVGSLDSGYFLFLEETDWCRRIRAAGWRIHYVPRFAIVHYGQRSMRQIPALTLPMFYASLCRFVRRGGGNWIRLRIALLKTMIIGSVVLRLALWSWRAIRQPALSLRMLKGYVHVLRRLPSF